MKFWIIPILILLIITPFILRAEMTKKLLFSNKEYAKQIEVKTYILTQQQVAELFNEPDKEPVQLITEELNKISKIYFIVRAKNSGKKSAWGKLSCNVPGIHEAIQLDMPCIREFFCTYVICIADVFISHNKTNVYPSITYKWDELYTK